MSAQNRPQHYRIRRMVQMVRESTETGYLANSGDFMKEFEVSRRTVVESAIFFLTLAFQTEVWVSRAPP
jgi:hypothetical protein